jgi:hypothetical protein
MMVRVRAVLCVLLMLAASIGLLAQSGQELYQRGLVQEHAVGDLTQAIDLYSKALGAAGGDRALAAKALRRMAASHEKLGRHAEAVKAYAELVRSYPEQRVEVAAAQERLAALRQSARTGAGDAGRAPPAELADDGELAARLAAFLWRDAPDALLAEAARRGELREPAALERHVRRMLGDRRSSSLVDMFFARWLSLDRLKAAMPDASTFPHVDAELLEAMRTETRLFLQSQLRDDRDAVELWTANYTYVNERLARHYGMPGVSGAEFRRVAWPNANRAGLLGQAGLLTALSFPARTSPTVRGVYVLTRFLGMEAPSPPANVPPLQERPEDGTGTMRGRMTAHRSNPLCASCHAMFDPLGFALENFDAVGVWRNTDGGAPIDVSGAFIDGTRFSGPVELRAGLLKYRDSYYTQVTRQLLAYALNRKGSAGRVYDHEMPAVRQIVGDASARGHRWSSIFAGIAASAPFQMKNVVP